MLWMTGYMLEVTGYRLQDYRLGAIVWGVAGNMYHRHMCELHLPGVRVVATKRSPGEAAIEVKPRNLQPLTYRP